MNRKMKVSNTRLFLLLILLFITVGYAVLSANLNINGTSNLTTSNVLIKS